MKLKVDEVAENKKRNLEVAEAKRKRKADAVSKLSFRTLTPTNSPGKSFRPKRGPSKGSLARWNLQKVKNKSGVIQNVPIRDRKKRKKVANV